MRTGGTHYRPSSVGDCRKTLAGARAAAGGLGAQMPGGPTEGAEPGAVAGPATFHRRRVETRPSRPSKVVEAPPPPPLCGAETGGEGPQSAPAGGAEVPSAGPAVAAAAAPPRPPLHPESGAERILRFQG